MYLFNPKERNNILNIIQDAADSAPPQWIGSDLCSNKKIHSTLDSLFRGIQGNSFQEKLDTLNKCNCCPRHKDKRFIKYQSYKDTHPLISYKKQFIDYSYQIKDLKDVHSNNLTFGLCPYLGEEYNTYKGSFCICECRQLSRFICRQYPQKWEDRVPLPNEGKPNFRFDQDPNILGCEYCQDDNGSIYIIGGLSPHDIFD